MHRGRRGAGADVVTAGPPRALEELLLTGSGGPFRGRTAAELAAVSPEQALAHPNWSMGPKITIDSATLMNKGLELIEAHYLFGVPYERITVVLDPKSTVHSMARFSDGAILAHLGVPDMRTPIGYALAYPERPPLPQVRRLDLFATAIAFERPDTETFRCLALAEKAGAMAMLAEREAVAAGVGPAHGRRAHRPERRQRGRGRGVPGRAPVVPGDRRGRRGEPRPARRGVGRVARRRLRERRRGAPCGRRTRSRRGSEPPAGRRR